MISIIKFTIKYRYIKIINYKKIIKIDRTPGGGAIA